MIIMWKPIDILWFPMCFNRGKCKWPAKSNTSYWTPVWIVAMPSNAICRWPDEAVGPTESDVGPIDIVVIFHNTKQIAEYEFSGFYVISAVPLSYEQVSAWKWSDSESIRLVPARCWHQWGTIMSNPFHEFSININQWHLSKNYKYMYDIYKHIYTYVLGPVTGSLPAVPPCPGAGLELVLCWEHRTGSCPVLAFCSVLVTAMY